MIKLTEKSRKILQAIFRGIGIATVTLSLGACPLLAMYGPAPDMYGMPPDINNEEVIFRGRVVLKGTQQGIRGIAIWIEGQNNFFPIFTNLLGEFYFFTEKKDNYTILFTDVDGAANGGRFKQHELKLTLEEALALKDNPITIELEPEEKPDGE